MRFWPKILELIIFRYIENTFGIFYNARTLIFEKLMMFMEATKCGEEHVSNLTYAKDAVDTFYIPENIYIIGTMNTADRSLSVVDYAL
jgi:5-methylcytosine-specific restriction endonuclease McrBC GTP-binding regulatory subunit McrB